MNQKQQTASEAAFLGRLVATAQACNVYLNSSVKLVGVLEGFSSQDGVIWLRPHSGHGTELAMVYLNSISSICPVAPRQLTRGASRELTSV